MTDRSISPQGQRGYTEPAQRTAMCTLTLIYHEDLEPAIVAIFKERMLIPRYTKVRDVVGARKDSMADTDYPVQEMRHMLTVLAEREMVYAMLDDLRGLRGKKGRGLRGYVTPVEEAI